MLIIISFRVGMCLSHSNETISNPTGASPIVGKSSQQRNTSEQNSESTFNMDLSPFYDVLEDLKANISSLRKEAVRLI